MTFKQFVAWTGGAAAAAGGSLYLLSGDTTTVRWIDPNDLGIVVEFGLQVGEETDPFSVGMPTPDENGVYSTEVPTPAVLTPIWMYSMDAEATQSTASNVKYIPEPSRGLGLLCGVSLLAALRRVRR